MNSSHARGSVDSAGAGLTLLLRRSLRLCVLVTVSSLNLFSPVTSASSTDAFINHLEADVKRLRGEERVVAHGRLAMALDANGRIEGALRVYRRLARQRGDDRWRYLLGVMLVQSGQYVEAVRVLRRVTDRLSDSRKAQFWLAVAQQRHHGSALWPGEVPDETVAEMTAVDWSKLNHAQRLTIHWTLDGYPDDPLLDQRIGYIRDAEVVRDYVEAASDIRPLSVLRVLWSLQGDRTFSELLLMTNLGAALGQESRTLEAALAGIALAPEEQTVAALPLHRIAARLFSARGRDDLAYSHLIEIVGQHDATTSSSEEDRTFVEQLGLIEVRNGRQQIALELLLRAGTWTGAYQAGLIEGARQNYRAAIAAFEKAIALNPECDRCFYFLGQSLGELGRFDAARDAIRRSQVLKAASPEGERGP